MSEAPEPGSPRSPRGGSGRPAGRPPTISREAILEAGLEIGLANLSIAAVADRLGVTRTSVHRHVGSRRDLETLVGEHLVEADTPSVDLGLPLEEHLLAFAWRLVGRIRDHPGLAAYYARGFPRTRRSAEVVEDFDRTLVARGIPAADAVRLAAAVADQTIALTAYTVIREQDGPGPSLDLAPGELPILQAELTSSRYTRRCPRFARAESASRTTSGPRPETTRPCSTSRGCSRACAPYWRRSRRADG